MEHTKKAKSIYLKYRAFPVAILKFLAEVRMEGKKMLRKGVRGCQQTREGAEKKPLKNKLLDS
jgi:hypothetical protein